MKQKRADLDSGVPKASDLNQQRQLEHYPPGTNQSRTVGMMQKASDYDQVPDELNPFTQMESNPEKLHRCVEHLKGRKGVDNPWAVCNASIHKGGK